jgi:protease I
MEKKLTGKKIAILATDGVEQSEFEKPIEALKNEGATIEVVSLKKGMIKAWKDKNWGDEFNADIAIDDVNCNMYDALVLPGGVINPDLLRVNRKVIDFVTDFIQQEKPIGAICHGPWTLIETDKLHGRKLTSYASIKTDIINAGAIWIDAEVVVDNGLVTSRNPKDLPAFCKKLIEEIKEGVHVNLR